VAQDVAILATDVARNTTTNGLTTRLPAPIRAIAVGTSKARVATPAVRFSADSRVSGAIVAIDRQSDAQAPVATTSGAMAVANRAAESKGVPEAVTPVAAVAVVDTQSAANITVCRTVR